MKAISIKNIEKLTEAINAAEGRATARTITAQGITRQLEYIEKTLRIKKKDMVGIKTDVDIHAQNFPNAYKYRPESTHFRAERRSSGWYITDIYRCYTRGAGHEVKMTLTEEAEKAIILVNTEF